MKAVFVALCLIVAVVAEDRERRFLVNRCSAESDCGANKCCLFNKVCSPKLPKYSTCHLTSLTNCGCADGLECRVTKEFEVLGQKVQLRQCMTIGEQSVVEKIENEELKELSQTRKRRFLIDTCASESDCGDGRCCLFDKICAKKIPQDMTCYLQHKHKCGCADGLECRVTTTIVLPISGTRIPIRQCVPPSA
ncbi:uncharacterized protein LOC116303314 [Actinia tenebrosa]|uniref:Uncharacterized protein LOC116303314 n=1 Tax=Actinia tenebrosa TaxID=6105 RepID=A0A6P8IP87_ACTTE|nr:uncharacterized protein LOC116303314 [Actinia tenebrosa]